ncbi:HAD family hydrolase [Streptomyces pharetrae]|uniref:HAD family hydrolase n=1 Tax=Streptomyces pharetrae TaxID=291370 RepID=UPI00345F8618
MVATVLPRPQWIIADVGASVIDAERMAHDHALEARLRTGRPGTARVRAALKRFPYLVYQEQVAQEGRCSFYLAPEDLSDGLIRAVGALGCSWSYASERYFDVLPPRADKGTALRLLAHARRWPRQANRDQGGVTGSAAARQVPGAVWQGRRRAPRCAAVRVAR